MIAKFGARYFIYCVELVHSCKKLPSKPGEGKRVMVRDVGQNRGGKAGDDCTRIYDGRKLGKHFRAIY